MFLIGDEHERPVARDGGVRHHGFLLRGALAVPRLRRRRLADDGDAREAVAHGELALAFKDVLAEFEDGGGFLFACPADDEPPASVGREQDALCPSKLLQRLENGIAGVRLEAGDDADARFVDHLDAERGRKRPGHGRERRAFELRRGRAAIHQIAGLVAPGDGYRVRGRVIRRSHVVDVSCDDGSAVNGNDA